MRRRQVTFAASILEAADQAGGARVQGAAIRRFRGEPGVHILANHFSERDATFASLGPQSPCLVFSELDLRPDHDQSVITS